VRYLDTAYIIKLYLVEHGSEAVMQAANESGGLASSALAFSGPHGALHRNLRDIYSSDRHLLTVAPHLGITGVNVIR
jgi:hypothetical protein